VSRRPGFSVVGACIDRAQGPEVEGVPVVGTSTSIVGALRTTGADTVAVGAWSDLSQSDLRRLSWQLEGSGVDLVVAPSLTDVAGPRIHIRPVSGLPLLHVEEPEFSGIRRLLKNTVDRSVAAVALLMAAPLLLTLAIVVRLTSRGPAFFTQERVGTEGERFTMYKLRSMYVDAEQRLADLKAHNQHGDGVLFKMKDDPRVTPVGRHLRRFSLDELPQLINVVKGDMSLVGPRPPLQSEVKQYQNDVRRRLLVKPGSRALAGQRPLGPVVGRVGPPRPALRRELVPRPGPAHPLEDPVRGPGPARCLLSVAFAGRTRSARHDRPRPLDGRR
jgi:lipopolysaccharide/colanic/teichoic acid biosynthesis glycosyltransferase